MVYKLLELRTYMIDENCGVFEMLQEIPAKEAFEENGFILWFKRSMQRFNY